MKVAAMFFDPRQRRVFIHRDPVDLRQAHNGLSNLVTHGMGRDLLSGDIFLFVSRDRKTAKALVWDGTGLAIFHKRMEKTRIMSFDGLPTAQEVSAHDFTLVLGGAKVTLTVSLKPSL
jgi:transposase